MWRIHRWSMKGPVTRRMFPFDTVIMKRLSQMSERIMFSSYLSMTNWRHLEMADEISRNHDDVIKWKHFPRYWPFVRGIHRSPANSPHKGQWRRALIFLSAPSLPLWRHCNVTRPFLWESNPDSWFLIAWTPIPSTDHVKTCHQGPLLLTWFSYNHWMDR